MVGKMSKNLQLRNNRQTFHFSAPIGIYTGQGASHSWIWFVDTLEKNGVTNILFLDENGIKNGSLGGIRTLVMGGGDAFAMADGLAQEGAEAIKQFIHAGGLYIGACAGAYLMMDMDEPPLHLFSVSKAKVLNIVDDLPACKSHPEKLFTFYGQRYVLHPVREAVKLALKEVDGISHEGELLAPLYGGPPIELPPEAEEIARYLEFVPESLYLIDEQLARNIMLGRVAAFRQAIGLGWIYLFGPHVEHPFYPEANQLLMKAIMAGDGNPVNKGAQKTVQGQARVRHRYQQLCSELRGHLSDARLAAYGMEMMPLVWRIGHKTYEPAKIIVFLDAIWRRLRLLEQGVGEDDFPRLVAATELAAETVEIVRNIKRRADNRLDSTGEAISLFPRLKKLTTTILEVYFHSKSLNNF